MELNTETLERLSIMTVEGGLSDEEALWKLGLSGTIYDTWLKEHPIGGG